MKVPNVFVPFVDLLLAVLCVVMVNVAAKQSQSSVKMTAEYLVTIEWDTHSDTDIDLWAVGPTPPIQPVFYKNREHGALHLDRDSRGWIDDKITGVDGSVTWLPHKEMITIRGIIPGRYDFGIHFYANHMEGSNTYEKGLNLSVHVEVIKVNPTSNIIFQKDVTLDHVGDALNFYSMNLDMNGGYNEIDPPLMPIALKYISDRAP